MRRRRALVLSWLLVWPLGFVQAQTNPQTPPLRVCLQSNDPPLSARNGPHPGGFAQSLSERIASHLGRIVQVQWFVSRDDPDADYAKESNALLADGHCELVAEFPLLADALAPPVQPFSRLPPYEGARPDDRKRIIKLGELAATRPYRLVTSTIVLSPSKAGRPIERLADLGEMKLGVQIATLADAIAMQYQAGRLIDQVVHVPDGRALFDKVASGELDAAFVDLRAFDAWRLRHPDSGLTGSGYVHSLGYNMGFVGLATDRALIDAVDTALGQLQGENALAPLAGDAGLTWLAPREPAVAPHVRLAALNGD